MKTAPSTPPTDILRVVTFTLTPREARVLDRLAAPLGCSATAYAASVVTTFVGKRILLDEALDRSQDDPPRRPRHVARPEPQPETHA